MDVLATALRKFHFAKTVYCAHCTNRAPWGVALVASQSVHFHAVRAGHAWIRLPGEAPVHLETGDFVVLPHGDAHEVCDERDTPAAPVAQLLAEAERSSPWILGFGRNGGARSVLICAGFACASGADEPLLSFLPRMLHLRASETASLEPILTLAEREMRCSGPATDAVLARLAEILVVETVRTHLKSVAPGEAGWLGALHDPQLSSVLQAIHAEPARRWTIATLASLASMSRTSLATRFRSLLGTSVHAYISRLRMRTAAALLDDPKRPKLARVAAEVGYGSEAAFSRAFLREMGVAPTKLRPGRPPAKPAAERSA
ncbi:MAG TPA: AraC family transcriptional regulator [Myxococcota bacterium]|nr:AraC family transcriptional regulator [Myxococcota bacterium]